MNPFLFISGLSWQTKLIAIAALFIAGVCLGWQVRGWRTEAAQAHSIAKQLKASDRLSNEAAKIITPAIKHEVEIKTVYKDVYHEIEKNDDNRICFADNAAISLWNSAIAGESSHRPVPDARPAADETADSQQVATVKQVLTNAAENFETCNLNIIHHQACVNMLRQLDGKVCVCGEQ